MTRKLEFYINLVITLLTIVSVYINAIDHQLILLILSMIFMIYIINQTDLAWDRWHNSDKGE